jgi:hypothetical protein
LFVNVDVVVDVDVDEFVDDHAYDNVDVHVHGSELAGMAESMRVAASGFHETTRKYCGTGVVGLHRISFRIQVASIQETKPC